MGAKALRRQRQYDVDRAGRAVAPLRGRALPGQYAERADYRLSTIYIASRFCFGVRLGFAINVVLSLSPKRPLH